MLVNMLASTQQRTYKFSTEQLPEDLIKSHWKDWNFSKSFVKALHSRNSSHKIKPGRIY